MAGAEFADTTRDTIRKVLKKNDADAFAQLMPCIVDTARNSALRVAQAMAVWGRWRFC